MTDANRFQVRLPDRSALDSAWPVEAAVVSPTGVVVSRRALSPDDLDHAVELTATPAPGYVVRPSADPALGQLRRLTGRVIDRSGSAVPAGLPVVLWGVDANLPDAAPRALAAAETQTGGYFGAPWPDDLLASAYAVVKGTAHAPVVLEDRRLPMRVILVVGGVGEADPCDCHTVPPRAPGQADLVGNPAAFSQDLGGTCVDLTMPNRVLEEYNHFLVVRTTEPDVRPVGLRPPTPVPHRLLQALAAAVAAPSARAISADGGALTPPIAADVTTSRQAGGSRFAPASALDASTIRELLARPEGVSVDALNASALTAATREALRLVDLLGTTSPVRTELDGDDAISWDASPTVFEAVTAAIGHVLHFRQVWRADGYSLGDLVHSIPLAPGEKRQIAVLDWERQTSAARAEDLEYEEAFAAVAERDRDINEIAGSHLDERTDAGSDSSTWAAGGGIGAGFIGGAFGIFGGVAGGASGSDSSSWQDSARTLAASSLQQLRDRTSQRASAARDERSTVVQTLSQDETSEAQTEFIANYNHCHAVTVEYFEVLRHFLVTHELASVSECLFVPLPMRPFDAAKARRWRAGLAHYLRDQSLLPAFDALDRIATNWAGWDYPAERFSEEPPEVLEGELRVRFVIPRPRDADDGAYQVDQWRWLQPLMDTAPLALWNAEMAVRVQAERDLYFREHVAPGIAEQLMHHLRFGYVTRGGQIVPVNLRATLVSRFAEGVGLYVSLRPAGPLTPVPREQISRLRIWLDDLTLPPDARVLVESGRMRYDTAHLRQLLFDAPHINNDLARAANIVVATPLDPDERGDPRADDRRLPDRLVRHLNENLEYYFQAVCHSMDAARRYLLLDGIIAPNAGGRSAASVVENRLLGIVGNCLVLPVTPGIHLDPTLVPDPVTGKLVDLVHAYAPEPAEPVRISVPTRGVYAEAVMGACDSCEVIDDTRFWRWEESPDPDNPTAIAPLSTDSRATPDPTLTPTPLPAPIVNIQNAAALPDPVGLQQALEILGQSDVFRDPTGLAGTQRNALGAFKGVMDTAKVLGGTAAKLAGQQELGRSVDRTLQQISQARSSGLLTDGQAQDLAHKALQGLVGTPAPTQTSPMHDPVVAQAIDHATQSSTGEVRVTEPGETVHAVFDDGGGTALGAAAPVPKFDDLDDNWINLEIVKDHPGAGTLNFVGGVPWWGAPFTFQAPAPITTLADLRTTEPLRHVKAGEAVVDFWDALVTLGRLRVDPADASKYQVHLRLHICYPADAGHTDRLAGLGSPKLYPVVVLAHGQHQAWMPKDGTQGPDVQVPTSQGPVATPSFTVTTIEEHSSYLGYEYLQEELAKQGIVSVSVDSNVANFFDCHLQTRADLVLYALRVMNQENKKVGSRYKGRLDLGAVGLVGHSRGGDGVVRAAKDNLVSSSSTGAVIRTVCSLAPTDTTGGDIAASRMSLDSNDLAFYYVLYGALDGDVFGDAADGQYGSGFRHYDRARCPKAMTFLDRFAHNGFNTVWYGDNGDDALLKDQHGNVIKDPTTNLPLQFSRPEDKHQQLAIEYIGDLMRWQLKGEPRSGRFDGRTANSLGEHASLQWMFGSSFKAIDDFENPNTNLLGGNRSMLAEPPDTIAIEDFGSITIAGAAEPMNQHTGHQTHVLHLDLSPGVSGAAPFLTTDVPADHNQDWTGYDTLIVSLSGWFDPTSDATIAGAPLPRTKITLLDRAGGSATVDWTTYGTALPSRPVRKLFNLAKPPHLPRIGNFTLMRLETIPIPLSAFTGVNLSKVSAVAFVTDPTVNPTHVFIDNVHLLKR